MARDFGDHQPIADSLPSISYGMGNKPARYAVNKVSGFQFDPNFVSFGQTIWEFSSSGNPVESKALIAIRSMSAGASVGSGKSWT